MKLIKLTNRYYFLGFLVTVCLGGVISFFLTQYSVNQIYKKKLFQEKEELLNEIKRDSTFLSKEKVNNIGSRIFIKKVLKTPKIKESIKDTLFLLNQKLVNYKKLTFVKKNKNQYYIVNIAKPVQVKTSIVKLILEIVVITSVLLLLSMLILTSLVSKNIWNPFYNTITQLKSYNIENKEQFSFSETDIFEFKELNAAIKNMTSKVEKDYRLLKEYTENVSHEIQTPLAIIKNKIELLLQDQNLNREHLLTLAKLHQSTGRLSKLSKNLSILTKIENNQFVENIQILLADFITERLEDFEELITLKQIKLETHFEDNPKLLMNSTLAYLLFNNLISNAVRHNVHKGKIAIKITDKSFVITNTGNPLKTSKIDLFKRFSKSTDSTDSTGLGLSMVKKIISFYGFYLAYKNENDLHSVSIIFIDKSFLNTNV